MAGTKNFDKVVNRSVKSLKDAYDETLARTSGWKLHPSTKEAELVFLMLVSALANLDTEMSCILLKEILPINTKQMFKWKLPMEKLRQALKFARILQHTGLFTVPAKLIADLEELVKMTALWEGVMKKDVKQIQRAVACGANMEETSEDGMTVLTLAAKDNKKEVVEALLDLGAQLEGRSDGEGDMKLTALHWACWKGHKKVVELLLERGANVNAKTTVDEWTPLHFAASCGHLSIAKQLVDKGADINCKNSDGKTPIDLAKENDHSKVFDYLRPAKPKSKHSK